MNIGGREYKLKYDPASAGAAFSLYGDEGQGTIVIGTKLTNRETLAENVLHECMEALLMQGGKSLTPHMSHIDQICDDPTRYVFLFDHDFLLTFCPQLLSALLSSGWFKIQDPRPRKK